MNILGVDLGTAVATASFIDSLGNIVLVGDRQDGTSYSTPAAIYIGEDGCLAGNEALAIAEADPRVRIISNPKTLLGNEDPVFTDFQGRRWSSEGATGLLFKKIKRDLQGIGQDQVSLVGISVPARFSNKERRAVKDAAKIAGFESIILVEQPIVVATYHSQVLSAPTRNTLIVDLGYAGSAFSVLKNVPEGLSVATCYWEPALGRQAVEMEVTRLLGERVSAMAGKDITSDPNNVNDLRAAAIDIIDTGLEAGPRLCRKLVIAGGQANEVILFSAQLEPLFHRQRELFSRASSICLDEAGMAWADVEVVVIHGELASWTHFQELVNELVQGRPVEIIASQPLHAVAYGAALAVKNRQALAGGGELLMPASSSDLGITVFNRQDGKFSMDTLIKRGSRLPASARKTLYTNRADQKRIIVQLGQRGGAGEEIVDLGFFEFGPITRPRKNYPVELAVTYDSEGIVTATAFDPETGTKMDQIVSTEGDSRAHWIIEQRGWVNDLPVNDAATSI